MSIPPFHHHVLVVLPLLSSSVDQECFTDVELKQKIDAWLAEKRAKAAAARLALIQEKEAETAADDTKMDTDDA